MPRTVKVGDHRFILPFIDLIPFDESQDTSLGDSIKDEGAVLVPVLCWKEKKGADEDTVIDGAHRVLWAAKHGLDNIPRSYRSFPSEQEAKECCESLNYERRHLTRSELSEARKARVERVAERRRAGESVRVIAEAEKISTSQVVRDVETAGVPGGDGTPEPKGGKVVGRDSKTYPATKPQILCERCLRVGAVEDCEACKELREKARKKPRAKPSANGRQTSGSSFKREALQAFSKLVKLIDKLHLHDKCRGPLEKIHAVIKEA